MESGPLQVLDASLYRRGHFVTALARWVSVGLALVSLAFVWESSRMLPRAALAVAVFFAGAACLAAVFFADALVAEAFLAGAFVVDVLFAADFAGAACFAVDFWGAAFFVAAGAAAWSAGLRRIALRAAVTADEASDFRVLRAMSRGPPRPG